MTGTRRVYGAPRLPSWLVPRPHLVGLLDDGSALVVVRGPGGGGKTVLLAEWAQTSPDPDLRGAWYDLGDRDVTRRGFWAGVAGRLVDAGLVGPGDLLATASASMREVGDVRAFLVRGFEQVGPVTLVLDTVDRLDDETTADLLHVLGAVPTVRAIVAGRSASRLAAPELRLRLDVRVVDADALALSTAETARLLGVDDQTAATARQATGGSPLVTRALALEHEHTGHLDPEQAVESLVLSAVTSLEPDVVGLLRRTVVADAVSVDLAEGLTGRADAAVLLDQAEALGLGTWNRPGHERVFTYTTVVRAALRADLRRSSPELFAELRGRVARWADTHDRPVEALEAAVDAGDVPLANSIVRNHWRGFLTEYAGTVRRTVSPLGLVRLRRHPLLVFFVALGFNADRRGRARAIALFGLAVASARVARSTVPPEERLVLRAVEMIALRLTGRGGAAAGAADDVVRRIDDLTPEQHAQILDLLPQVYAHCGVALLHARRSTDAVAAFERGLGEATTALAALPNLALLAGTHALEGSMSRARALVEDARGRSWPEGWVDGYTGSLLQVAEALLAVEDLDVETAQHHLDLLERHLETIEHWPLIAHVQALVDLLGRGADAALERLEATRATHQARRSAHPATESTLVATRALLLVAAGRAHTVLVSPPDAAKDAAAAVALARAQLAAGLPEKTLATLAQSTGAPFSSIRTQTDRALLESVAALATGHETEAVAALSRASALLAVHGLRLPVIVLSADDRERLRGLAGRHGLVEAERILGEPWPEVVPSSGDVPVLTPRETVILRELARTGSTTEIAERLVVSNHTVKSQLRTLYRKLGVGSRSSALAVARRLGLLDDESRLARLDDESRA